MQSDNEKMLQEIVQNTEMGKNTLDELMGLTHDQKLKDEMLDKSTRNLATMLAEGSGQGVLDCKRAEKDYPTASPGAMQLCHELGRFQSEAEQTWRGFV